MTGVVPAVTAGLLTTTSLSTTTPLTQTASLITRAGFPAQTANGTVITPLTVVVGALVIVVLLGVSAFFSGSEIAIFSLERHQLSVLLEADEDVDPRAAVLQRLREDPHRLLVTILVGNNMVNIAMASIASVLLAAALSPELAIVATTLGMSALVLVFGEITPKSYGVANAESLALRVAGPIRIVAATSNVPTSPARKSRRSSKRVNASVPSTRPNTRWSRASSNSARPRHGR
jgi:hypothetical protein